MKASPEITFIKVNFKFFQKKKLDIKGKACIIYFSIGQPYCDGEKLLATMDLINETFSYCKMIVCDSLQRHTLMIRDPELSEKEAYEKSILLGNEWFKRNESAYKYLTIESDISRWESWRHHERYSSYFAQIIELYSKDELYRNTIDSTINAFLMRNKLQGDTRAFNLCKRYVLEESPILVPMLAETKIPFIVYPSFRTAAMTATYNHFIQNDSAVLNQVSLNFSNRTIPKKLSFSYVDRGLTSDIL